MRIVAALGGNALLKRGEPLEARTQESNIAAAAKQLATLTDAHELIVTHGNGPQVGLLALQSARMENLRPYPLDVLGAETEGMIGYVIERELRNCRPQREFATLLTQTLVDPGDPAFERPTKFVGAVYDDDAAAALGREFGWHFARDGAKLRRVVPSPKPQRLFGTEVLRLLVERGVIVVCAGGGGIPVAYADCGQLIGVEAVIDKDLASAWIATELAADALVMLTDVDGVYDDWATAQQRLISQATTAELRDRRFAEGSMGPKVEAAIAFAQSGSGFAAIGSLDRVTDLVSGKCGTTIRR